MEIGGELMTVASITRRLVAYLLDVAPFGVMWVVIVAVTDSASSPGRGLALVAWLALFLGYFSGAIARYGKTLGMRATGIRVVSIETGGNPRWGRSLVRAALQCVARPAPPLIIALPIGLLVYGPVLFVRHSRGLHDLAAATVVADMPTQGES